MFRGFDQNGRIVIPKEMRDKIKAKPFENVKIDYYDNKIIITNPNEFDIGKYVADKMEEYEFDSVEWNLLNDVLIQIENHR